jgi:hypothetical protein
MCDERESSQEEGDMFEILLPDEFLLRCNELARLATKMRKSDVAWQRQEGREMLNDCQGMQATVQEAKDMGDPSDPAVQAYWAKHRTRSTVAFSFESGKPKKSLDQMNRDAPDTGRTGHEGGEPMSARELDSMAQQAKKIYRKPVKKKRRPGLVLDL